MINSKLRNSDFNTNRTNKQTNTQQSSFNLSILSEYFLQIIFYVHVQFKQRKSDFFMTGHLATYKICNSQICRKGGVLVL